MGALAPASPVAVIGAGTMGRGIARVAAAAGHVVYLYDAAPEAVARAIDELRRRIDRSVAKGRTTAVDGEAILGRVVACATLDEVAGAGLVIEAIVEDLEIKRSVFAQLETLLAPDAVFATNTSSLSVTAVAAGLEQPERLGGMHFFNPAPVMPLVEVVRAAVTSDETVDLLCDTATAWGKTPVVCSSTPGFIVNRVARPFYGEGLRLVAEGVAGIAAVDALLVGAGGFRMGPFRLMDLVGLDVSFAVSQSVYEQTFHDPRFAPNVLQRTLVDAGHLGRKAGRGFYDYSAAEPAVATVAVPAAAPDRVVARGDLGWASGLVIRLESAGVAVDHAPNAGPPHLFIDGVHLVPTDGRTATQLAAGGGLGSTEIVVLDLVGDWGEAGTVGVAVAAQASEDAGGRVAALLAAAGMSVIEIGDAPGLAVMRTVAQLAGVAADAVTLGVATPHDIDTAMKLGTNYPSGPLEWADRIGPEKLVRVLENLNRWYGEDRYRAPARLRLSALVGRPLSGEGN